MLCCMVRFGDWFLTSLPEGREEYAAWMRHTHFVYETHPALQMCTQKVEVLKITFLQVMEELVPRQSTDLS